MSEVQEPKANAPASPPPSLPRRLFRWWNTHPAMAACLGVVALLVSGMLLEFARSPGTPGFVPLTILSLICAFILVSFVRGGVAVVRGRHHLAGRVVRIPIWKRVLQGLALLALTGLIILPYFFSTSRMSKASHAANDTKKAVTEAIAFAAGKGSYPTSLGAMQSRGVDVRDRDLWNQEFVLAPVLTQGGKPQPGDDVYVYSRGPCGTGTYEPPRWRKQSDGSWDTGKCGAVGYSSVHGAFRGQAP